MLIMFRIKHVYYKYNVNIDQGKHTFIEVIYHKKLYFSVWRKGEINFRHVIDISII